MWSCFSGRTFDGIFIKQKRDDSMIIKRELFFESAKANRTLHIWLPDNYYETQERFPVMYFFDGHNLFLDEDATYGKSWGLKAFLESWEKPMIVVGIECSHEGSGRLTEYCPYKTNGGFLGYIDGKGDATVHWMVNTLKPMIDRDYRTYSFREATGIGGSSMGGLMSLFAGIKYNQYFSKAVCVSSAIGFCRNQLLRDIAETSLDGDTRFYLSWGEKEAGSANGGDPAYDTYSARCNREMAGRLEEKRVLTRVFFQKDGGHNEASWEKQLPEFMNYLWLDR